jgi:very-short-patch-repair endonuclease
MANALFAEAVRFEEQHSFPECAYKRALHWDFWLPDLNALIEMDGGQHFKVVGHWGGLAALESSRERDQIKNDFVAGQGYHLLRVSFSRHATIHAELSSFLEALSRHQDAKPLHRFVGDEYRQPLI